MSIPCSSCGAANPPQAERCGACGVKLAGEVLDDDRTLEQAIPVDGHEVLFGRYQVLAELGRGGMGRVLRVRDQKLGEVVALKLLSTELASDERVLERFRNELKLARRISHRNVCRVFDLGVGDDDTHFITMEVVPGEPLTRLLAREGKLAVERLLAIADGICRGLAEAHRLGVVHRDLKPGNIIIDSDGEPRILDFGLARSAATAGLTKMGSMMGTPSYMSPEQVSGTEVDARSDIYALGVILFEMAVGHPPFRDDSPLTVALMHKTEPAPDPLAFDPSLPSRLAWIIGKCLAKEPDDRFLEIGELQAELDAVQEAPARVEAQLPAFLAAAPEAADVATVFVGRGRELDRLDGFLESALAARGRVVFVTGEPGSGKSTLTREFTHRALDRDPNLVVSTGRCDAQTGTGDPYQPFRQALELLTGDIEARWGSSFLTREAALRLWNLVPRTVSTVVDHGPDLLETLLLSGPLLERTTTACGDSAAPVVRLRELTQRIAGAPPANVKQTQVLDQYSRVLVELSSHRPLLLVLEDLHWLDSGSADLLFQLGRRIVDGRILILGTSRREELALGRNGDRHPLEPVLNELKRDHGDVEIALDEAEGREFLEAYLDSQPNRLDGAFRDALFRQTRGFALFTAELLHTMAETGMLVRDDEGFLVEGSELDWEAVPDRTEGLIRERLDRLPQDLREILDVASIEGRRFTAEVTAALVDRPAREVVKYLSGGLAKKHRLVEAEGMRRIAGQRLSIYGFRHVLFQKYLYGKFDEVERSYMHEDVAQALEGMYGEMTDEIAVELGAHYEASENYDKSAHYYKIAGERALRLSAFKEANEHLSRAIELLGSLPETPERRDLELEMRLSLANGLIATEGFGSKRLEEDLDHVGRLSQRPAESTQGMQIIYRLWGFHFIRGHQQEVHALGDRLAEIAAKTGDDLHTATAEFAHGVTAFFEGRHEEAIEHLPRVAERFDAEGHPARMLVYSGDPLFDAWCYQAWAELHLGRLREGWSTLTSALAAADGLEAPFVLCSGMIFEGGLGIETGRPPAKSLEIANRLIAEAESHGFPFWLAHGFIYRGLTRVQLSGDESGIDDIVAGLGLIEQIGARVPVASLTGHLAHAYLLLGRVPEGLEAIEQALALSAETIERKCLPDLHRFKGELLLRQGADDDAEEYLRQAISVAKSQKSSLHELKAAVSLARLLGATDRKDEIDPLLRPVFERLACDFDSVFLREAEALLADAG